MLRIGSRLGVTFVTVLCGVIGVRSFLYSGHPRTRDMSPTPTPSIVASTGPTDR